MDIATLRVKEMRVDKGVVLKRSMPRAFGRAFPVHKHSSHIMIVLDEGKAKKGVVTKTDAIKQKKAETDKPKTAKTRTTTASEGEEKKKVAAKKTAKTTK
jgi:hypothetical protein